MSLERDQIHCPSCGEAIAAADADWTERRAWCPRCEHWLELVGYIEPPNPELLFEHREGRGGEQREVPRPPGLALKRSVAPGVESFTLGRWPAQGQLRFEGDQLVIKGALGREHQRRLEQIRGFAALQYVTPPKAEGAAGQLGWRVCVVLTDGALVRVWDYDDRAFARSVAAILNQTLSRLRPDDA